MAGGEEDIRIEQVDPDAIAHLLSASRDYFSSRYPAESNHTLGPDYLRGPGCIALGARSDGGVLGCVALVPLATTDTAEVKGLFVEPNDRGRGIGRALMVALEATAIAAGYTTLLLETGSDELEALALYASLGWQPVEPFGDYVEDPHSVFLRKILETPRV